MIRSCRLAALLAALAWAPAIVCPRVGAAAPPKGIWSFDCGPKDSLVAPGYTQVAARDQYSKEKGFGWETPTAKDVEFTRPVRDPNLRGSYGQIMFDYIYDSLRNDLNRDAVVSEDDLVFRLDVPDGTYRVCVTLGDMSKALGSMDVLLNDKIVGEHVSAWAPGSYRMFDQIPAGFWTYVRGTVEAKGGLIRIAVRKNQSFYDEDMAKQAKMENPFKRWYHGTPIVQKPPYYFCGWPFIHNSVMAIEVDRVNQDPDLVSQDGVLKATGVWEKPSPEILKAVEKYNAGDFDGASKALDACPDSDAKALLALRLAGRLETENERALVQMAVEILRKSVARRVAGDYVVHPPRALEEALIDAESFDRGMQMHVTRGQLGKVHFIENNKAIGQWLLIPPDSPLYDKAQLHLARAAHMLHPYLPTISTEEMIFKRLEAKCPTNRFVRYHLYQDWDAHGDGSQYYDWPRPDYAKKAEGAPEWVRALYPLYRRMIDLGEWWVRHRQEPEGGIGGGWGDDVEMVGLFGYYGYISRGVSDLCIEGTRRLANGVWNNSEVDPEMGFCLPLADAEHSAEWTGDTLGMMVQIDYGNPNWIEYSLKTARLMRDLWTGRNDKGLRSFRSNHLGAAQVGQGDQMSDSNINYRAVRPAAAVLWYNQSPPISRLFTELADNWVAAAMSTGRGKPMGVLPQEIGFPDGKLGGINSPNWWTSTHTPGTDNYDFAGQDYKPYIQDLLLLAYRQTRDPKYLAPLRLEYELVKKHGIDPQTPRNPKNQLKSSLESAKKAEPGSEPWAAAMLLHTGAWEEAKRLLEGRKGELANTLSKDEVTSRSLKAAGILDRMWPLMTTEAGPTDRVGFEGEYGAYQIYTGGAPGGPLMTGPVTYENTTADFAAAVLGHDPQGLRLLYYSLAPGSREIRIVPWELDPGTNYVLTYGPDKDGDDKADSVTEKREFAMPQSGTPIPLKVDPNVCYVVEVQQQRRGKPAPPRPDPGLSAGDVRFDARFGLILARIHNLGSKPAVNLEVAAYDGDPKTGGALLGKSVIPNIEAPLTLEPCVTNIGFSWRPTRPKHDVFIVVDPDGKIGDEITSQNNIASRTIETAPADLSKDAGGG